MCQQPSSAGTKHPPHTHFPKHFNRGWFCLSAVNRSGRSIGPTRCLPYVRKSLESLNDLSSPLSTLFLLCLAHRLLTETHARTQAKHYLTITAMHHTIKSTWTTFVTNIKSSNDHCFFFPPSTGLLSWSESATLLRIRKLPPHPACRYAVIIKSSRWTRTFAVSWKSNNCPHKNTMTELVRQFHLSTLWLLGNL